MIGFRFESIAHILKQCGPNLHLNSSVRSYPLNNLVGGDASQNVYCVGRSGTGCSVTTLCLPFGFPQPVYTVCLCRKISKARCFLGQLVWCCWHKRKLGACPSTLIALLGMAGLPSFVSLWCAGMDRRALPLTAVGIHQISGCQPWVAR